VQLPDEACGHPHQLLGCARAAPLAAEMAAAA
jgi:hypothetical protein